MGKKASGPGFDWLVGLPGVTFSKTQEVLPSVPEAYLKPSQAKLGLVWFSRVLVLCTITNYYCAKLKIVISSRYIPVVILSSLGEP